MLAALGQKALGGQRAGDVLDSILGMLSRLLLPLLPQPEQQQLVYRRRTGNFVVRQSL